MGAPRIGMPLQGILHRANGLLGAALAIEENSVVDTWVVVRRRSAIQLDRLMKCCTGFRRLAQGFRGECDQSIDLRVVQIVLERLAEHIQSWGEAVQQVE